MTLIELNDVRKVYKIGDQEIRALDGVDLQIGEREFISIIGPSGSGKSTLMHLIGCLDTPSTGLLSVCGHDLSRASSDQLAYVRNKEIGFVFQSFNLLSKLTVSQNVELPMIYAGIPASERKKRALELIEAVQLSDRVHNRPTQLSGGQCQRVAIARALANDPKILLADEPTGNLDSTTGKAILDMLQDLHNRGRTVILVTHDPNIAALTQRVVELKDGRIERTRSRP
jgi:putative ABC transport system ATP-binding protein